MALGSTTCSKYWLAQTTRERELEDTSWEVRDGWRVAIKSLKWAQKYAQDIVKPDIYITRQNVKRS